MLSAGTEDAVASTLGELEARIWLSSVLGGAQADMLQPEVVRLLGGATPAQFNQLAAYAAQDAALTTKLLADSGAGVLVHLGSPDPVGTVQELERSLRPPSRRVPVAAPPGPPSGRKIVLTPPTAARPAAAVQPAVPPKAKAGLVTTPLGQPLWDDVPTDPARVPTDFVVSDDPVSLLGDGSKAVRTEVTYRPTGASGYLSREYNPRTRELVLRYAFLDELPSRIQNDVPLVPGRGTPLQTYLTIRQMKLLGVGYGDVKSIKLSMIANVEGLLEIHWLVKTGKAKGLDEAVMMADSFLYARTNAEQSGKQVVGAKLSQGGDFRRIGELMVNEEQFNPVGPNGMTRAAFHRLLLAKYQASANDTVYENFDIYLELIDHPAR
jgi:hypothetical protein